MGKGYDVAQVCMNGHVITSSAGTSPEFRKSHSDKCGESTIMACQGCRTPIRDHYHCPGVIGFFEYDPPSFCHNCGSPFPWTERKKKAALALFAEEIFDEHEQQVFADSLEQASRDTPEAQVASFRLSKLLKKTGEHVGGAIRDILVDIASETAKKTLFPGP